LSLQALKDKIKALVELKIQERIEVLSKAEDSGYCTMFLFEGCSKPDIMHVTHKYFGKAFKDEKAIVEVLEKYFKENPFKEFSDLFDKEEMFGVNNDVRVLRPASNKKFLPDFKDELDKITPDKFPEYKPHVTVSANVDKVDYPIVDYVLAKGGKVLWSAKGELYKAEEDPYSEIRKVAEDLDKGAAKRLFPFNPTKDVSPEAASHAGVWQTAALKIPGYEDSPSDVEAEQQSHREKVTRAEGSERMRMLNKLGSYTTMRRHPQTGERTFLMFRGHSPEEALNAKGKHHVEHNSMSSWTPDLDIARGFKNTYDDTHQTTPFAAWIKESDIHAMPMMYGNINEARTDMDTGELVADRPVERAKNFWQPEKEVIVQPHTSQRATNKEVANYRINQGQLRSNKDINYADLNQRINARGNIKAADPLDNPIQLVPPKPRATEKAEDLEKVITAPGKFQFEAADVNPAIPHDVTQKKLVHGVDVHKVKQQKEGWTAGNTISGKAKNASNERVIVKAKMPDHLMDEENMPHMKDFSTAHREAMFHNMAKNFWGLGKYVPTTSLVSHNIRAHQGNANGEATPPMPEHFSVQQMIPSAKHFNRDKHGDTLDDSRRSGELQKLGLMDMISGNSDRHPYNWMMSPRGIHLIDHGFTYDYSRERGISIPSYMETANPAGEPENEPLHPDARNWLMNLKAKDLKAHLKAHNVPSHIEKPMMRAFKAAQNKVKLRMANGKPLTFGDLSDHIISRAEG
jgi:hypothetical protein